MPNVLAAFAGATFRNVLFAFMSPRVVALAIEEHPTGECAIEEHARQRLLSSRKAQVREKRLSEF
jgi:hypothetical protein